MCEQRARRWLQSATEAECIEVYEDDRLGTLESGLLDSGITLISAFVIESPIWVPSSVGKAALDCFCPACWVSPGSPDYLGQPTVSSLNKYQGVKLITHLPAFPNKYKRQDIQPCIRMYSAFLSICIDTRAFGHVQLGADSLLGSKCETYKFILAPSTRLDLLRKNSGGRCQALVTALCTETHSERHDCSARSHLIREMESLYKMLCSTSL